MNDSENDIAYKFIPTATLSKPGYRTVMMRICMILAVLIIPFISFQPVSAVSVSDYFEISYQLHFNQTQVTLGKVFTANANGTALCKEPLPITVSSATVTSCVIATSLTTGARVTLNPNYAITISPFPSQTGSITTITQDIPLTFPIGANYGTYSVTGELIEATLQATYPLSVTSFLPQSQYMGTISYAPDPNGDGVANMGDVTKVERIILGIDSPTPGSDANNDGTIDMADVIKLERVILGID